MSAQINWTRLDEATKRSWEDESRRLISVEIRGLFGLYDYTIPLEEADSRIVFLHGPNGVGKSTILRMIKAYADGGFAQIMAVPFDQLTLTFSDSVFVEIHPPEGLSSEATIIAAREGASLAQTQRGKLVTPRVLRAPDDRRPAQQTWHDLLLNQLTDEVFARRPPKNEVERLLVALNGRLPGRSDRPERPPVVAPKTCVELIEADRLLTISDGESVERVQQHLDDLTGRVGRAQEDFSETARRLDRTYKRELIAGADAPAHEHASVKQGLERLFGLQKRLLGLGLAQEVDLLEPEQLMEIAHDLPSWKLAALGLSTQQSLELYESLEHIAVRLEALRDLVNDFYQDKQMRYQYGGAVQFVQLAGRREIVPPTSLSSGEKHIFTLIYRLLFDTKPGAQVLIDEPELSLHISWQRRFAGAMERIGDIQELHYILATHSPQIVGGRTDSMVALTDTSDDDHGEE